MRRKAYEISYFVCPECGNKFPIPRKQSERRKRNHIKDLYCPFCKKIEKQKEIRPCDLDMVAML